MRKESKKNTQAHTAGQAISKAKGNSKGVGDSEPNGRVRWARAWAVGAGRVAGGWVGGVGCSFPSPSPPSFFSFLSPSFFFVCEDCGHAQLHKFNDFDVKSLTTLGKQT